MVTPTGGATPWTGGTCGGAGRPVVLLVHGYTAHAVGAYQGLVDHLVSNGFVVAFPGYTDDFDPDHQYRVVDAGFTTAVDHLGGRVDTSRVGVVGHSFGAGMVPWLLQQAGARGWGGESMWAVSFAPWFSFFVGDGAIAVPAQSRVTVVGFDEDRVVDARIGIEVLDSLALPAGRRRHVMVRSDRTQSPSIVADHNAPVSLDLPRGPLATDHLDRWAVFPVVDATARCALDGGWCDADLSDMGTWPDGRPVQPAIVSGQPVDAGPHAAQECDAALNPRLCPA